MQTIIRVTIAAVFLFAAQATFAACDLTDLPCWGSNSKCNIKFRNKTGEGSGAGGGTPWNQMSWAGKIRVVAKDSKDNRIGNTLTIDAGASKTINLDKKSGFAHIDVTMVMVGGGTDSRILMSCKPIRAVLQRDDSCKVFYTTSGDYRLAYNCGGGDVVGAGGGGGLLNPVWYLDGVKQ